MKLTDLKVRNAKPRAKPYNLPDGRSLLLAIQPTGGKLWRGDYRFDGKQKTLAMGCYPDVSIEEARRRWDDARNLKLRGSIRRRSAKPTGTRKTTPFAPSAKN
jgi:hypothetical protein